MCYSIKAGDKKIDRKPGTFELLGCDIMIDAEFKPYLIEMNTNPAITLGSINTLLINQIIYRYNSLIRNNSLCYLK